MYHHSQLEQRPVTTCTAAANYSFNAMPDVIVKAAFEPGFGHYEIFGILSRFRDRVYPCEEYLSTSHDREPVRCLWRHRRDRSL